MSSITRIDYIGASWCKVCTIVKPAVVQIAKDFGVELVLLDADTLDEADAVSKVPTLRVYKNTGTGPTEVVQIVTAHLEALKNILTAHAKVVISDEF